MVSLTGHSLNRFLREVFIVVARMLTQDKVVYRMEGLERFVDKMQQLRKPNVKYSADEYDLSSIRTRSRRTIRTAMSQSAFFGGVEDDLGTNADHI